MGSSTSIPRVAGSRARLLTAVLGLALAALAADAAWKAREAADAATLASDPVSVPHTRLRQVNGRFHRLGSPIPFTGWLIERHPDGSPRLRSSVVNGLFHGESLEWAANGVLVVLEAYQHGVPNGVRRTWYPDGRKRSEGRLIMGLQQGYYWQWSESGALIAEAVFDAGKAHGLSRAWYPSGCLKAEASMNHGEVVTRRSYLDGAQRQSTLLADATHR